MKIVHIAPYGPNRAGIYEAARDMVRADALAGHDVAFVDVGAQAVGKPTPEPAQVGAVDDRGGYRLVTAAPSVAQTADVLIMHTGCPNEWVVTTQAPFVWVVHGTPLAAFRAEQEHGPKSYSLYAGAAQWPRTKAMVYFWPEFRPYWDVVFPADKSVVLDYPPVDRARFSPDGAKIEIPRFQRGRYNGLICDSWRDDCDILELTHGALEAGRRVPGLTWHIYAVPDPNGPFGYLIDALRQAGMLGSVGGRRGDMEQVFRGMDFVLSARRSISRVIAEAVCCGVPVVAARYCTAASYTADIAEPGSVAAAVQRLTERLDADRAGLLAEVAGMAEHFDLTDYGATMTALYQRLTGGA